MNEANLKLKEEALKQMQQPIYSNFKNNTQFSIKVGQAANQALELQIGLMKITKRSIFNWTDYKRDIKQFFKINKEIEEELA
jgi:hypothetical protein